MNDVEAESNFFAMIDESIGVDQIRPGLVSIKPQSFSGTHIVVVELNFPFCVWVEATCLQGRNLFPVSC